MESDKVFIVNSALTIGGAEKMIAFLANTLSENYDVTLILLEKKEIFYEINRNVRVIRLDLNMSRSFRQMGVIKSLRLLRNVCSEIRSLEAQEHPKLAFAFNDRETMFVWWALRHKEVKMIFSQRNDPYDKSEIKNIVFKYIYQHSSGAVFQLDQVQKFYGMTNNNSVVIPNPCCVEKNDGKPELKKLEYGERKKVIISAGRFQYRKRFDILIRAFAMVSLLYPEYKLIIFGDGDERRNLEQLSKMLEIDDKVEMPGFRKEVMRNYSDSAMFVLSSDAEGIPNILLEAIGAGIPCIAADCKPGGARFLLDEGKGGIIVERGREDLLSEAMITYIEDRECAEKYAKYAFNFSRKFTEDKIADKWLSYVKQILEL